MQPSGVRLLQLINTRILEIAKREFRSADRLRLYGTGGWWTAFEHSAYALSRLFPGLETFVVTPPGCPFSIVGATVSEKALNKYMKTHPASLRDTDYLEFPSAPFQPKDYDLWHTATVSEFLDIVNPPAVPTIGKGVS